MKLSPMILDALSWNESLKHLTIDCNDWDSDDEDYDPELFVDLYREVVLKNDGLESLTLVSHYDCFDKYYRPFKNVQRGFDLMARHCDLNSSNEHSLSRFLVTFPYNRCKSSVRSNELWESQFSPALLLNCLCCQLGGCPPVRVFCLAIQSINKGRLYSRATNLVP
jgi:hypothetical protein